MKDFHQLFINELKRIYSAEKQQVEALSYFAKTATSSKLKEAFHHHLKETKEQVKRLEKIAKELDEHLTGYECHTMKSLLKEGRESIKKHYDSLTKDAALIDCAQKIEHYEIASYGILKSYARHFRYTEVEKWLEDSSKEEGRANKRLTEVAEGTLFSTGVNLQACKRCA